MSRLYFVVLLGFASMTTACAGSAYKLPLVNQNEIADIENTINSDNVKLEIYNRSNSNYQNRLAVISKRLQKSAKPLCQHAEYMSCSFQVEYSDKDIVNAYAHENSKITVHKGLLKYLKSNDEMAAVVAHEMGHHLANHNQETADNAATGAAVSGILTAILISAANANNPYYNSYQQQQDQQTLENMMRVGAEIGVVSYSKEQEREADLLGAYLLDHAGYNLKKAQNLLYIFSKISGDEVMGQGEGKAALLDTHPPSTERVVAWGKAIEEINENKSKLPYLKSGE